MSASVRPFVLAEGLDADLSVLEASAGTGKTFALVALCALAVGRGEASIGELCVVTFTDAATAELRGRLRERLAQATAFLDGDRSSPSDELEQLMAALDGAELDAWSARMRAALRDFDTASITTIHGFCSRVVDGIFARGAAATLVAETDDVDEVVRDVLLARLGVAGAVQFDHARFLAAVKLSLSLSTAVPDVIGHGVPGFDGSKSTHVARADAVAQAAEVLRECVDEIHRRRRLRNVRTFDDLLADTRSLLVDDTDRTVALELRRRFRIVLVDEFQDTDRVQWDILRIAFLEPVVGALRTRMVIVGDPKQSIYRFRSAELSAYLDAVAYADEHSGDRRSLTVNRRSDQPLLEALNSLFEGFTFGDRTIGYVPVTSPDPAGVSGLDGCGEAVVQIRIPATTATQKGPVAAAIVPDVCDVIVDLLSGPTIMGREGRRDVRPSDIGVLVSTNAEGRELVQRLRERNVPAVASSNDSVLDSRAAAEWRHLLRALERPSSSGAVRRAALGWFDEFDAAGLASLDDPANADRLSAVFDRYREWSRLLVDRGLPALLGALRANGLSRRVLSRRGGERDLTDLEHIAELLQSRTSGRVTSAAALLDILDDLAARSTGENASSELYDRRIDRDDDTVRVMTIHKSKGLEFEIVLVPSLWGAASKNRSKVEHASIDGVRRIDIDLVVPNDDKKIRFDRVHVESLAEREGEERRRLYVALTRAKRRLVIWFPTSYSNDRDMRVALRDLLTDGGAVAVGALDTEAFAAARPGVEFVAAPATPHGRRLDPVERGERELVTAVPPVIDRTWRRWSFTAITRVLGAEHDLLPVPVVGGGFDEPVGIADEKVDVGPSSLPLLGVPGGAAFGTLVHRVLERVDFVDDGRLDERLRTECGRSLRFDPVGGVDVDRLAAGLAAALRAPLGGPLGERTLTGLGVEDRLNELVFDLPLGAFDVAAIADVVLPHLDADDVFRPWFETATNRHLPVEGMLNGSIDLVARTVVDDRPRFWLADYKTNVIAEGTEFDLVDLAGEMARSDYVLQTTLYQVALHRLLRWRLGASYDPGADLLGSAYLFVRGMDPSRSAADARGVLWWRLPLSALSALDELFAPTAGVAA